MNKMLSSTNKQNEQISSYLADIYIFSLTGSLGHTLKKEFNRDFRDFFLVMTLTCC